MNAHGETMSPRYTVDHLDDENEHPGIALLQSATSPSTDGMLGAVGSLHAKAEQAAEHHARSPGNGITRDDVAALRWSTHAAHLLVTARMGLERDRARLEALEAELWLRSHRQGWWMVAALGLAATSLALQVVGWL